MSLSFLDTGQGVSIFIKNCQVYQHKTHETISCTRKFNKEVTIATTTVIHIWPGFLIKRNEMNELFEWTAEKQLLKIKWNKNV